MIYKLCPTTAVKGARPRTFTFIASTGQMDRDRDRIPVDAWQLDRFKDNPTILWSHKHDIPPIGRALNVRTSGDALKAEIEFAPEGIYELADTVHGLVASGFLKATSVGFRPSAWTPNEYGGKDYQHPVELLEISVVNLPANVGALLERRSDYAAVTKWLRGEGPALSPRAMWEECMKTAKGRSSQKETAMTSNDKPYVLIADEPRPQLTPAAAWYWREQAGRARLDCKLRLYRELRAGLPATGRYAYVDDPEIPHSERVVPVPW